MILQCAKKDRCGACQGMGQTYQTTLQRKQEACHTLFQDKMVLPILPMKDPSHYRHKVTASFRYSKQRHLLAGLYEEDSHRIVEEDSCVIQNETANEIVRKFTQIAQDMHLSPYQEDKKEGVLRHLLIRVSHSSGKAMVVIVIGSRNLPGSRELCARLKKECPSVETILIHKNDRHTSLVLGQEPFQIALGKGTIEDVLCKKKFQLSPSSFFQVNPVMTEVLYQTAIAKAQLLPEDTVLDICCGIGTIGLIAADACKEVIGVEYNRQAIQDARENQKINGIKNAKFFAQDAEAFMKNYHGKADVVFLDPPRSGFTPAFIQACTSLKPKRIVYISCNPESFRRDGQEFKKYGYSYKEIQPLDCFPYTSHVETVTVLTKVK